MRGELNKKEILDVLNAQYIGRLGCHLDGETYVVPVNYVYHDNAIYAHSGPGKKIEMLRANPEVCFQVDEITSMFNWKSVILWGSFEELKDQQRQQVMQRIIQRIMPSSNAPGRNPSHGIRPELRDNLIVYRINIREGTGRYESHAPGAE